MPPAVVVVVVVVAVAAAEAMAKIAAVGRRSVALGGA